MSQGRSKTSQPMDSDAPELTDEQIARADLHEGGRLIRPGMRRAANAKAWALGKQQGNGFQVRRVVWGLTMASMEKRPGEEIRSAVILVGGKRKR